MKIIFRLIAFLLFLVFFGFALKNTDEVVLHLFWNAQTKSPLILLLLAFFILGAVLGVLAMTTTLMRYRREATRQKNLLAQQLKVMESAAQARLQTPFADSVIQQAGL
ncbi:MAG: LapA family protein [Burkholderiaceae bacterium]